LENVEPEENVLGEINEGYKSTISILNEAGSGVPSMIGLAQGAFDYASQIYISKKQFGKLELPECNSKWPKIQTEIEAARLMTYSLTRLKRMANHLSWKVAYRMVLILYSCNGQTLYRQVARASALAIVSFV
jgi:alkylation response protein AidB-like acyl-CoA dehydrogenase